MLSGLLGARQVIDYLYGEMRETQHLRERLPSALEWEVSRAVEEILSHPCKMVMKAQSQHAHWLLPDAIASVLKLHITLQQILDTPVVRQHDEEEEERVMRVDIKDLQDCMCRSILKDTNYLLAPVREFIPARGHEVMALLLDPRFCRGNFFLDAAPPAPDDRDRKRSAKALMRQYNDEVLKPTLAQLSKFIRHEQQEEADRGGMSMLQLLNEPCVMRTATMRVLGVRVRVLMVTRSTSFGLSTSCHALKKSSRLSGRQHYLIRTIQSCSGGENTMQTSLC